MDSSEQITGRYNQEKEMKNIPFIDIAIPSNNNLAPKES